MTYPKDSYSRKIFYIKVILSVLCLVLFSVMLFYVLRSSDILVARKNADGLSIIEQQIDGVRYQALTKDGNKLKMSFDYVKNLEIRKRGQLARQVFANLILKNGRTFYIFSDTGFFDTQHQAFHLSGDVRITSSDGSQFETKAMKISISPTQIETKTPIYLKFQNGVLRSNSMLISAKPKKTDKNIMTFSGNVHLTYYPSTQ